MDPALSRVRRPPLMAQDGQVASEGPWFHEVVGVHPADGEVQSPGSMFKICEHPSSTFSGYTDDAPWPRPILQDLTSLCCKAHEAGEVVL